jgi:hypothetical protein
LKKGGSNDRHSHVSKSSGSEVVPGDQRRGMFITVSTRTSIPRLVTWFLTSITLFLSPFVVWDVFRKEFVTTLATIELTDWEWDNLPLTLVTLYAYLVINVFLYGEYFGVDLAKLF